MSSSDPRRQNNTSYTSRPTQQEDLSWLDFLRTAGGTVPPDRPPPRAPQFERRDSADRKRRHTGSEPERRNYPYPTSSGRPTDPRLQAASAMIAGGSSRETAIDLTSPPRPARPSLNSIMQAPRERHVPVLNERRESDLVLPRWQPDGEVDKCPVCQAEFSFWYRKHHCRKCGRVVCANCSPHRITIPRQYIVQPPNPYEDEANPGSSPRLRGNPNLGGGEVVRVCNPCVPDPWTPNSGSTTTPDAETARARNVPLPTAARPGAARIPSDPRLLINRDALTRDWVERDRPERYRTISSANAQGRVRSYTHQAHPSLNRPMPHVSEGGPLALSTSVQDGGYPRLSVRYGHRHSQSNVDRPGAHAGPHASRPPPPIPTASAPVAPAGRREIREEDECPVCGVELPPGESLREIHIRQCIETRFSSTPTQPSRTVPPPAQEPGPRSPLRPSSGTPPVIPEGSRPRSTSYRPRGMALYRATEKDCTTEEGDPQECVICFEEFEEGDEMGRMECLCKFHRHCIRQWWDTKGTGSCPTHQLHD